MITVKKRPYDYSWSGNPIAYELESSLNLTDPDVYIEVRVMFKFVGDAFAELVTFPINPSSGIAKVDVSDILNSKLEYGMPSFPVDETDQTQADKQTGYFYIQFREISIIGSDPTFDTSELDFAKFVLKG